jgi:hypothetical protein
MPIIEGHGESFARQKLDDGLGYVINKLAPAGAFTDQPSRMSARN